MPSRTFRRGKNLAHAPRSHPRGALPAPGSRLTVGISNGRDLLPNVDGRGIVARRYRDIICAVASDQGGAEGLSEARLEELICVVGRRGGKSRAMATLACHLAGLCDHNLAPGERGVAAWLAAQASRCCRQPCRSRRSALHLHTAAAEPMAQRSHHQRDRAPARGVQASDQDADGAALGRHCGDVVGL
jgi:hypothetical protein